MRWSFKRDATETLCVVPPTDSLKLNQALHLISAGTWVDTSIMGIVNAAMVIISMAINVTDAAGQLCPPESHLLRHGFATEMRRLDTRIDVIAFS